ncbi:MAG: hypothetical protein ACOCX2_08270 [Armatimonadota bacterium]
MDAILGSIFQALTRIGGGSELAPLIVFCIFLVVVGLGLGLGTMRLLRKSPPQTESDADGQ